MGDMNVTGPSGSGPAVNVGEAERRAAEAAAEEARRIAEEERRRAAEAQAAAEAARAELEAARAAEDEERIRAATAEADRAAIASLGQMQRTLDAEKAANAKALAAERPPPYPGADAPRDIFDLGNNDPATQRRLLGTDIFETPEARAASVARDAEGLRADAPPGPVSEWSASETAEYTERVAAWVDEHAAHPEDVRQFLDTQRDVLAHAGGISSGDVDADLEEKASVRRSLQLLSRETYANPAAAQVLEDEGALSLEPKSAHLNPIIPAGHHGDIDRASVELTVDELNAPDQSAGLTFYAIQVNFDDGTGAHGGPQQLDDGKRKVNWGGLDGGDYAAGENDPDGQIANIINPQGDENTPEIDWENGHTYRLEVVKGDTRVFEPGDYESTSGRTGHLDEPTEYQGWEFRMVDTTTGEVVTTQTVYNHAEHIESFGYWTETGYGFDHQDASTARWNNPEYEVASAPGQTQVPTGVSVGYIGDQTADSPDGATAPIGSTSNSTLLNPETFEIQQEFGTERTNPAGTVFGDSGAGGSLGGLGKIVVGAIGRAGT